MPAPHNTSRAHSRITGSISGEADDSIAMISTVVASGIVTTIATMMAQIVRSMSGAYYDGGWGVGSGVWEMNQDAKCSRFISHTPPPTPHSPVYNPPPPK